LIQLTGRKNYRETGTNLGLGNKLEEHPEFLRVPSTAFSTAISFWQYSGANAGADRDDVTAVRAAINGGSNGLADAKIWLVQAKKAFAPTAIGAAAPQVAAQETEAVLGKLQELGYVEPSIAMNADKGQLANDGLKRFQAAKGLPQTGILDEDTLYALTDPSSRQRDR
jgi:putative chitinase